MPPVTVPVVLTVVPVITPPTTLAPVITPVTLTVVPECNVALTFAPPSTLPPVMLPVALINPPVSMLPPVMLPVATTVAASTLDDAPANTVVPPEGLVIITAVALADIWALPRLIVLLDSQISLNLCVELPKS